MDGFVVLIGLLALLGTLLWLLLSGLAALAQRLERRYDDEAMPVLRAFVHRGCDFDRQKYLESQLRISERRLQDARRRHSELFALAHPQFKTPVFPPATMPRQGMVTLSDRFYHGQVRSALRRAQ